MKIDQPSRLGSRHAAAGAWKLRLRLVGAVTDNFPLGRRGGVRDCAQGRMPGRRGTDRGTADECPQGDTGYPAKLHGFPSFRTGPSFEEATLQPSYENGSKVHAAGTKKYTCRTCQRELTQFAGFCRYGTPAAHLRPRRKRSTWLASLVARASRLQRWASKGSAGESAGNQNALEQCAHLNTGFAQVSNTCTCSGSTGLVKCWSKPASLERRRSSSWP